MTTIAFISPCGFGNLGDVAIQDAFIDGVHTRLGPGTTIVGITQNPEDTARRHHVRAVPMDADGFRLRRATPHAGNGFDNGVPPESPPVRPSSRFTRAAKRVVRELVHWAIAFREMRPADALVVSGGGQLDEHWGGPWRTPYALWKWSLVARLQRKEVIVLSVGAGTLESPLTRRFLRSALRRARYVSFRDDETAARARSQRLSASTRVVPDLAFGYVAPTEAASVTRAARNTVVVSPIAFLDPTSWPRKDDVAYRSQLSRSTELTRLLLARGLHVILCTSNTPDLKPATALYDALAAQASPGTLELSLTSSPVDLLETFARADIAIASRLHGLILANIAGTPTIALSYDWKVDVHMRMVGLEQFVHPIETFEPDDVIASVDTLLANRVAIAGAMAARCESLGDTVRAQYVEVFDRYASADGPQHEHGVAAAGGAE